MPLPKFITNLVSGGASKLVDSAVGLISQFKLSPEEKLKFEKEMTELANNHALALEQEMTKQFESENNAVTERWKADMGSDSWLSKNTRPLVMLSLLGALFLMIIFDSCEIKFEIKESYISLIEQTLTIVIVAYFGGRSFEKVKSISSKK